MDRERAEEQIQIIREYNEALRQERDKLRAEVARLTAEVAKDREWLGRALDKQAEYLRQCGKLVEERDTLRAEAARLREALENLIGNCQTGPNFALSKPQREWIIDGQSALSSTPTTAEWLAARDAELRALREQIGMIREYNEALRQERDTLRAEAARLREALETIDREMSNISEGKQEEIRNDLTSGEAHGWTSAHDHVGPIILAALSSTPSTSEWLAARDTEQRRIGAAEWLEKTAAENHERFGTHFYESTTDSFLAEAARLRAGKGEKDAG